MLEEGTISYLGTHYVQFQVTNSLGDTEMKVFPVEVYSGDMYNAQLTLNQYMVYLPKGAAFTPERYLKNFILLGEEVDLTTGLPEDFSLKTKGTVQTQYPGVKAAPLGR